MTTFLGIPKRHAAEEESPLRGTLPFPKAARRALDGYVAPALDPGIEAALADFIARRERELPDKQD